MKAPLALPLGLVLACAVAPCATGTPVADPRVAKIEARIDQARDRMMIDPAAAAAIAQTVRTAAAALPGRQAAIDEATATWLMGEALVRINRLDEGGAAIDRALAAIHRLAPGTKIEADVLQSRSNVRAIRTNVAGALTDIQAAHEIYRKIGYGRGQATALITISSLYLGANDYATALKYTDQALQEYRGDARLLVSLRNNRGDILRELGRSGEAETEFRKALALARQLKSEPLQAAILRNIARNELAGGYLTQAARAVADAFRVTARLNSAEVAQVHAVNAQLLLQRHDLGGARREIERTFAGGTGETGTPLWQAHRTAYAIYRALNDDGMALRHLEALKKLDDQTNQLTASANTALMAARFDFASQALRISRLQAEDARRRLQYERTRARLQQWIFIGAGIAATVIVAMLAFGIVTLRRSRNAVRASNIELAGTNAALEKALSAKTEFLATTSHEIRTPLNGILGMTQVMLADQALAPATRDRIQVVHGAGISMRALVDDILDVAKMETGKLTIETAPVDLPAMLRDVSRLWEDQARAKGVAFAFDIAGAPALIEGDPARLRQIVFNLLSNAFKFTQQGAVALSCRVVEGDAGERLSIVVRDTGIGIPRDKLEMIFESFRQADAGTTRQFGGTGLGLAICRNIARAMGGDVTVESEPGVGSAFALTIPLRCAIQPAPTVVDEIRNAEAVLMIVDRNPVTRAMLKSLFAARMPAVEAVGSPAMAREAIAAGRVSRIVIDDATLNAEDEMDARLTELAAVPVTVLWPSPDDGDRARFARLGVDQVVARPISAAQLVASVISRQPTHIDALDSHAA